MSNKRGIFEDYYSKEYNCINEYIEELHLYIQEIPRIFERRNPYEFGMTIIEIQEKCLTLLSKIDGNLDDWKRHFDHIVDVNKLLEEKLRYGKFYTKGGN